MLKRLLSMFSRDESPSNFSTDTHTNTHTDTHEAEKSDLKTTGGLTDKEVEILSHFLIGDGESLTLSMLLLHAGDVDFQFFPLLHKPMWFQISERVQGQSSYSSRPYINEFTVKDKPKLLNLKLDDTAPLAKQLCCGTPRTLDKKLSLYCVDKGFDGLITPGGNILLANPIRFVEPVKCDNEKQLEFLAFVDKVEATAPKKERLYKQSQVVVGSQGSFEVVRDFDVWIVSAEVCANLTDGRNEDFLRHFAQYKSLKFNESMYLCVKKKTDPLYLIDTKQAESFGYIKKIN